MVDRPAPVPDVVRTRTQPVRTCVGCRARAEKSDLVRVVLVEGRLVPDLRHRMPGRGASLHPVAECLELAERRRAFARALRCQGPVDTAEVRRYVEAQDRNGTTSETG